ncbi:unnamed protein product [Rotaria sp. Silwood2]|nr:unnamed protein product [Rotaria sp. Silwood2]
MIHKLMMKFDGDTGGELASEDDALSNDEDVNET